MPISTDIENKKRLIDERAIIEDECWGWSGHKGSNGYALIKIKKKWTGAHRASYEVHCGPIPKGMVIDHICHNPSCVNPRHLRAVSNKWNVQNVWKVNSSTGHRNVYRKSAGKPFMVQINSQGRRIYGGTYTEIEDAIEAAKRLREKHFPGSTEPSSVASAS